MTSPPLSNPALDSELTGTPRARKAGGFRTALAAEAFVARHSLSPWLLAFIPAAAVAFRLLLVKVAGAAPLEGEDGAASGYGYMVDGFATGLTLLYLVFIAYAAHSFAVDRDHGVLRHLVIRSVSRRNLVAAKLVFLHLLALLSVAGVLLAAYLLSRGLWELGPVVEDGFEIISVELIHEEIAMGLRLALLPLPACLALGVLISVLARSATQAVAIAVGVTLALDIFKNVLGSGAHFIYATFQPSLIDQSYLSEVARIVRGYSDVLVDPAVHQLNIWVPLPQAVAFALLAVLVVGRRKL
ncbi:ABC transporter permease subunit [Gilvimarinus sp. F26214L]|uniref:ABC transporter permease subunit n=1 Tax=Gilvimarinus sp. DZF01 TaxID=3461371 RepID=UPI00404541FB